MEKDERNLIIGFLVGVFSSIIAEWVYEDGMLIVSWIQGNLLMFLVIITAIVSLLLLFTRKTTK